jgi:hypothetical protein
LDGASEGIGLVGGDAPGFVLALLPDLMFEVRAPELIGIALGGTGFSLNRAVFHAVDLFDLLEDLFPFLSEWIH